MDTKATNTFKIRNLLAFLSVVEHGGLTRAAKLTNRSQGQLSTIIRDIEDSCGTSLFTRTAAGIELNNAGLLFARDAQIYIDAYFNFLHGTKKLAKMESNHVILYAPPGVINFIAENILHKFNAANPQTSITMKSCQPGDHNNYDHLLNDADVIISLLPSRHPDAVNKKFDIEMGFYSGSNFQLPDSTTHPENLLSTQCISIENYGFGSNTWNYMDKRFQVVALSISGKFKCHDVPTAISMASNNLGVIYIPNLIADKHLKERKIVRVFSDFGGKKEYYITYKKQKCVNNAALLFRTFFLTFVK